MYRCYGAFSGSPCVWSSSSNVLELLISGAPSTVTPSVQTPNATSGTQCPDYTVENLIRIGLSALVLVVLGVLVYQEWHSRRGFSQVN
ncbi:leukocyte immunoglobulin-like receptor subfamily A member 5 [Phyllostomus hastatus]|uniref:leukocyte immunoglobulin-like receptor subfamily A member 5 n=1 Tax=Phyllostomus hastatus TaxID=9423 RepID=UPI001E684545|nr:leukocyte immunoglobulin-like receptor subfamily A member 5 [Phyllostomus hastatus]